METQIWRKGDVVGEGRFEILKQLGRGGFGVTYLAYDNAKRRQIAIKTVNSDQQEKADFIKIQEKLWDEGFTLRGFPHRHIVRVYENVIIDGLLGFVMEYVLGQDLEKYVEAKGRLLEPEALRYIDQISQALNFVHQDKIFHRDVNPRNIMLRQDSQEAVLIDFGLAREFVELEPIYLSNTHGSELYKPVEQYKKSGVFGPPSDIYALTVTLYYLLNGGRLGKGKSDWTAYMSISRKRNYESGKGEEADRALWAELSKVEVSARTLAAIQAGMAIEPEDRPKNMTEFRELLGFQPAVTPTVLLETPPLSFPEPSITAETIPNSPELLIVAMPTVEKSQTALTASIPTKAKPDQDDLALQLPVIEEGQIIIVSTNPAQAYVYWDVPVKLKHQLRERGGRRLAVRMYDVTNADITTNLPNNFQEFECDELDWDLHLPVPRADRRYLVEIGYISEDNNWLRLARSKPLMIFSYDTDMTTYSKKNPIPSLTESNSIKSELTGIIRKQKAPGGESWRTWTWWTPKNGSKLPLPRVQIVRSPISRRLILQGLLGTGGLAGFGFVGLLLKKMFEVQPSPKPVSIPISNPKTDATLVLETIQCTPVVLNQQGIIIKNPKRTVEMYKENLGGGVNIIMVKIPAGRFLMGQLPAEKQEIIKQSNEGYYKDYKTSELPQHLVTLKEFYMSQTEVTQAQYQVIMGVNPSVFKGNNYPVDNVSRDQAREFCKKLSSKTGKNYTLPSESQWEYSCRAGTVTSYFFGDNINSNVANVVDMGKDYWKTSKKTSKVNQFFPNSFGLYDMHGNVWEWCEDRWHINYQGAPADGSAWVDGNSDWQVARGGSCRSDLTKCYSSCRETGYDKSSDDFEGHGDLFGFRLAYVPS
jgi:formylglycine-generating enzyme required for sulfatase activity/serine/threonine protein kinase